MNRSAVSDAEAYTVKCPRCKSKPGWTCTYMPKLIGRPGTKQRWDPRSGKPTKVPHAERREAYRRKQLRDIHRMRTEWEEAERKRLQREWRFSIPKSIRDGAARDQAELVAWLRQHARILTELTDEADAARFDPTEQVARDEEETTCTVTTTAATTSGGTTSVSSGCTH